MTERDKRRGKGISGSVIMASFLGWRDQVSISWVSWLYFVSSFSGNSLSLSLSLSLLTQSPTVLCSSITIIMLRYADFFLVFTVLFTLRSVKKLSLFLLRQRRCHRPPTTDRNWGEWGQLRSLMLLINACTQISIFLFF